MAPNFVVVFVKTIPATPASLEQNSVLEVKAADTQELAEDIGREGVMRHRSSQVATGSFGPGATQVTATIYPKPTTA